MEALLEKEGNVDRWNDDRLDEFSQRMENGFNKVNTRLDQMATRDDLRYLSSRIDRLMYGLLAGCAGIIGTLIAIAQT